MRAPRVERVHDALARVTPLAPPGKDRPGVRAVTARAMRGTIRRTVRALGVRPLAVLSGSPRYDPFGVSGERRRIFRASDDFSAGGDLIGAAPRWLEARERRLADRADAVVCVSPVLLERWRALGHDPVLIANGCDVERLATTGQVPVADDVVLRRPVAGYVGQLSSRIDLDALAGLVEAGHSLLLVGRRRPDLAESRLAALTRHPNVQWIGHRPFEELPRYLAAMDVALVPYADTLFNRASFPLKTLEYLAAGLPVVASDLPSIRWLDTDLVAIARDRAQFVDAVTRSAAVAADPESVRRRRAFASNHSWEQRAREYLEVIGGR